MKKILFLFIIIVGPLYSSSSTSCESRDMTKDETKKVLNLTGKVIDYLEEQDTELAFIARKNKPNHGITYTHLGIAWKNEKGTWVVTNLLQDCEDKSTLSTYDDGLALFYTPVKVYHSLILIPSENTQKELKQAIINKEIEIFKGDIYTINTNPWQDKYQNCVQYILESYTYIRSGKTVQNRKEAINWYREKGFRPYRIKVNMLERFFGPLVTSNVQFDDHKDRKNKNEIEIATAEAVMKFIKRQEPESTVYEVR